MLANLLRKGFEVAFIQIGDDAVLMRKRIRVILSKRVNDKDQSVALITDPEILDSDINSYLERLEKFWENTYP